MMAYHLAHLPGIDRWFRAHIMTMDIIIMGSIPANQGKYLCDHLLFSWGRMLVCIVNISL